MVPPNTATRTLPEILPVFPLTGVLLLPGTVLPLHVFELRYRNLVEDALKAEGIFGMIQPLAPQQDNRPLPGAEKETPELYRVGCAGRIEKSERLPDGRYVIQLKGLHRFRFQEELPLLRGYRRVKAAYGEFPDAAVEEQWRCDVGALRHALDGYGKAHGLKINLDQVDRFSPTELVNLLGLSLPFHPAEKQALLEARSLDERAGVLMNLLRLGAGPADAESEVPPRTIN